MLTRLRINGFKNLIDVDLHFGPFTCIAGANAVGKSNLFDAILFLKGLMDAPIMDAAMAVREKNSSVSDVRYLFTQTASGVPLPIEIEAEMLVPAEGSDYLDQPAAAKTTFLIYRLELRYRSSEGSTARSRIELVEETLDYVKKGEALVHLPFDHTKSWRDSVVVGRRTSPYISTEPRRGEGRFIKLHQDSSTSGGRTRLFQADKLPRTVLSTVNSQESPTAVLARQEMLNWRLLQLEPSALRAPDGFDAPSQIDASGAHLPATLYRLSQASDRSSASSSNVDECVDERAVEHEPVNERALTHIANRLHGLIDHVGQVLIDRDDKRELLTLLLTDKYGTQLPAKALSDGTLRFLALASVEIDPTLTGLICMEEPENGIHPERIAAILELLRDIAVDPTLPIGDDNPLRQVIINTHSPVVVNQVPDDAVVFAVPEQRVVEGNLIKGVSFRCLSETWRTKKVGMPTIAKGKAVSFLQPIVDKADPSREKGNRRVIDHPDLAQLKLLL
ncbi:MAG: AAA family ATPase [Gammaproteobacteria bacterium]|nr:AAA family ATPase [Gammaproteobacteria bacterium]